VGILVTGRDIRARRDLQRIASAQGCLCHSMIAQFLHKRL
jgi:hypothetical protein